MPKVLDISERTCKKCDKVFGRKADKDRHMNDVHNCVRKWKCTKDGCKYTSTQEGNCRRHMRSCHGLDEDPIVLQLVEIASDESSASSSSSSRAASPPVTPATPDYDYFLQVANGSLPLPSGSDTPPLPLQRSYSTPNSLPPYGEPHPYLSHQPLGYPLPLERHSMPELGIAPNIGMNLPRSHSLDSAVPPSWGQAPNPGAFLGLPGLSLPGIPPPPEFGPIRLYENDVGPAYLEPLDLPLPVPQPQLAEAVSIQRAPSPVLPLPPPQEDEAPVDTGRNLSDAELRELGIPATPDANAWDNEEDEVQAFLKSFAPSHPS